ncbi:hypothetical protein BFC17_03750 [Alteromonas lipolytica]|uniref:Peptidase C1A papain C-terminal domain-containing protein n=2 Tax=Alteromonas lipolytica TaxID=1856405 RepID=A0A1E8FC68_9ALTE|nr:hypothetical protein BFC17_03750 [Alteromonas lipolytica]
MEIAPTEQTKPGEVSQYGSFVIQAILDDMGLSLSDEEKEAVVNDDKKTVPKKEDAAPEPKKKGYANDMYSGMNSMMKNFKKEYRATVDTWTEEYNNVLAQWAIAKKQYKKEEQALSDATFDMDEVVEEPQVPPAKPITFAEDPLASMKPGDFYVIPNAMDVEIRNQKMRGTCAAFTGIRAVETVLAQHPQFGPLQLDLSEQHFYWLSKPDCFDKQCNASEHSEGSYFDTGFINSNKLNTAGPLRQEQYCPYVPFPNKKNLTYSPLANQCMNDSVGLFQVSEFNPVLPFDSIVSELAQNRPIAAGFTLTNSYKKTTGVVRANDPLNATEAKGEHVAGHAMLLIGFIKLPESMQAEEGRYCAIMANSWGAGYGVGGYACLTESWMEQNRFKFQKDPSRSLMSSVSKVTLLKG